MKTPQEMRVEMSLTLPAAMLCPLAAEKAEQLKAALMVERTREALCLTPVGDWSPQMLAQGLPKALQVPDKVYCLVLKLDRLTRLDEPALNALVALLRQQAPGFARIVLAGLPHWASARINYGQGGGLFGGGWSATLQPGMADFKRCKSPKQARAAQ